MKSVFKPKYATPIASITGDECDSGINTDEAKAIDDIPSSSKRQSNGQVSLTDSQYDALFESVSRRVLEGNFLDLDERFAGSQDALENNNGFIDIQEETKRKKKKKHRRVEGKDASVEKENETKRKRKHRRVEAVEAEAEAKDGMTPAQNFTEAISKKSPNASKRDNEITPAVSPQELNQNPVVYKPKHRPVEKKAKPSFTGKRKSLEYTENPGHGDKNGQADSHGEELDIECASEGTWVQCCKCDKWRLLPQCEDPASLPNDWTCALNPNEEFSECTTPEESWMDPDSQTEYVYTQFTPGSIVWAKMPGYPSWPAMVDRDPNDLIYFEAFTGGNVSHYHVSFLDDKVSRAWIPNRHIEAFRINETPVKLPRETTRKSEFERDLGTAKTRAREALQMSVSKRLEKFSFERRYHGKSHWTRDRNSTDKRQKRKKKERNDRLKVKSQRKEETKESQKLVKSDKQSDCRDKNVDNETATVHEVFRVKFNEKEGCINETKESENSGATLSKTEDRKQTDEKQAMECNAEISHVSMSEVSLEEGIDGDLFRNVATDENHDSSREIPLVEKEVPTKPIQLDPSVFTMEMGPNTEFSEEPVTQGDKGVSVPDEPMDASGISQRGEGHCEGLNCDDDEEFWSPAADSGVTAADLFDDLTTECEDGPVNDGEWKDFENLVMDE